MDNVPVTTPPQRYLAGRYRLEEVLGRGATGTVWAAYDEVLRRRVAVKEVPPPPGMPRAEAEALRERTLREARAIAVLSHPNVVTLFDVVSQDGEPFVVMELLPAYSLAKVLSDRGPLDMAGAAQVGYAVASALQAAHDAGITHRDVKPGNVLIGIGADDGRIKLTDFGIARNVAESAMTVTGMTLGSPAFIAPEVASGGVVGPAADLWGLGATLFAAVHGRPPYDAGDALSTVAAVVNGEVPRPTAGPLAPVISGLMVKDPARRTPLAEVRRMLRPLLPPDGRVLNEISDTTALLSSAEPTVGLPWAAPADATARTSPHAPLAADPGPLPFAPRAGGVGGAGGVAGAGGAGAGGHAGAPGGVAGAGGHAGASGGVAGAGGHAGAPGAGGFAGAAGRAGRGAHTGAAGFAGAGGQAGAGRVAGAGGFAGAVAAARRRRRSWPATAALVLASVLFFVCGAAGGFGLSRWAAGAPLVPQLSTARTTAAGSTQGPLGESRNGVLVQQVSVTNDRPGSAEPVVTRFAIGVPDGWAAYRPPLSDADTPIIAMFVSPEGNRTIAVDHLPGFYPKGTVTAYLATLRATMAASVDDVVAQPVNSLAPPAAGAKEGPFETSFRTVQRGSSGTSGELLRTTLVYLRPTGTDLWVIKVTVPSDQQKAADALYMAVVGSFAPL